MNCRLQIVVGIERLKLQKKDALNCYIFAFENDVLRLSFWCLLLNFNHYFVGDIACYWHFLLISPRIIFRILQFINASR